MYCAKCDSTNIYTDTCYICIRTANKLDELDELDDFDKFWIRCNTCKYVYNNKYCPCQACGGDYIEYPNGRHCEFCHPPVKIININFCIDSFPLHSNNYKNNIFFCQSCHEFVLDVEKGNYYSHDKYNLQKTHKTHTIIQKYHILYQIAKIKFPHMF